MKHSELFIRNILNGKITTKKIKKEVKQKRCKYALSENKTEVAISRPWSPPLQTKINVKILKILPSGDVLSSMRYIFVFWPNYSFFPSVFSEIIARKIKVTAFLSWTVLTAVNEGIRVMWLVLNWPISVCQATTTKCWSLSTRSLERSSERFLNGPRMQKFGEPTFSFSLVCLPVVPIRWSACGYITMNFPNFPVCMLIYNRENTF